MGGGGHLHPGPQSKSMIFPKNHLFPRHFKGWEYSTSEPITYSLQTVLINARKWGSSWALAGVAGTLAITYFCEWKYVLRHVPLINWPYKEPKTE